MFDLSRFGRLAAAQWAEYRKAYAWFIGIGIIVHFVLLLVTASGMSGIRTLTNDMQSIFYFAGLYLTGTLFAGRYFQAMARTESALVTLMRPASLFEKWLLALLFVAVFYPIAYTLAYYVCNAPASMLSAAAAATELAAQRAAGVEAQEALRSYPFASLEPENFRMFHVWQVFRDSQGWLPLPLTLLILQGFAVLGSLYFRSMPIIKTVLVGFLLLLVSILAVAVMGNPGDQFAGYWTSSREIAGWRAIFYPAVWFLLPTLLWLACLFALREREIS